MIRFYRYLILIILIFGLILFFEIYIKTKAQDIKISEIMPSNTMLFDEDGDTPDWLEIVNCSKKEVNLSDYYLSENPDKLLKWKLPDLKLAPQKTLLIYASGKDRPSSPLYWFPVINIGQNWKYMFPSSEPSQSWKSLIFDDSGWLEGSSHMGLVDTVDTAIDVQGKLSVFMRKKFTVSNLDDIKSLWLHMDYDDGFVAYINGTEVCRSQMGIYGTIISYNHLANTHEAKIISGGLAEGFNISPFLYLLRKEENVLAIQVHNSDSTAGDLTAIPFLTVGYKNMMGLDSTVSKYIKLPPQYPHTNFKLSASGEHLTLTFKDRNIVDSITYGNVPANFSFGREGQNIANLGYFGESTPGQLNKTSIASEIVKREVQFSVKEMFLKSKKKLEISGAGLHEEIKYTLNGSEPNQNSFSYTVPIELTKNTVVRARIFKKGAIPGKIGTRTYIFDTPPTLPVISISTDSMNLWDNETGIYVLGNTYDNKSPFEGANFWKDWVKLANMEMVGVNGECIFSLNCGIKIFGAKSRANDQKSLAVFFKGEYGDPVLENVKLFHSKPITDFKSLVLRNAGNDYNTRFRDCLSTDLVKNMETDVAAFEQAILYLNGQYWGHINLREKINEDFLESNHGVKAEKLDFLEYKYRILSGSNAKYLKLVDFIEKNSLVDDSIYNIAASKIDVKNFIDYQLSQIYFNNRDWPGNNLKYWRPQTKDGKWRWILFDTDFAFGYESETDYMLNTLGFALEPNGPYWPNPPWSTLLFRKLIDNQSFKYRFVNRFADMLNTTFVAESVVKRIDSIAAIIKPEIKQHYQKWKTPSPEEWEKAVQTMRFFAQKRVYHVQNHINQQLKLGGIHEVTISNLPISSGYILLNSIEVSGNNWKGKYFENVPIMLTAMPEDDHKFHYWEINGAKVLDNTIELNLTKATTIRAIFEK
ncbi:MAG: CotH kinase family protein [Prolixibacteraceae bacterium]|nr:CotH kinase family protein [Prolixibacteraceae bacterium]